MIRKADMKITIPYGKSSMSCEVSEERILGVLKGSVSSAGDPLELLRSAMDNPIHSSSFEEGLRGKKSVLIVVTDSTRKAFLDIMLPVVIEKIRSSTDAPITIIVATGMHKRHTDPELRELLGEDAFKSCKVLCHDQLADSLEVLGQTANGVPIVLDKEIFRHDHIITIGVIEPHLYAGFSGGFKTLAIGLAGKATINATHSVRFLDDPLVAIGSVDRNAFQNTLREIVGKARIDFTINTVSDPGGKPVKIFAGDTKGVFDAGVSFSRNIFEARADRLSDVVVCGVGYPKDINLYQASRAINYVVNVDRPVMRKDGLIIVVAELVKGYGDSAAELKFYEDLKRIRFVKDYVEKIRSDGCGAGEHRTFMVAKAMLEYRIAFVCREKAAFMENLPFPFFSSLENALRHADESTGKSSRMYIIPHALSTIPVMGV